MKEKVLVSVVLATFAGISLAAELSFYGSLNTGLAFSHSKSTGNPATNTFKMASSIAAPSCWGIRGFEELSDGYSVSFDLQSEFGSDDGTLLENRLFRREARLSLHGPFGEIAFGRMGTLTSSAGSHEIFLSASDANCGGWGTDTGVIGGFNFFFDVIRADNTVSYVTPSFSGLKFHAQYSFKTDGVYGQGNEGRNSAKRYAGVGLSYKNGPLSVATVFDATFNRADDPIAKRDGRKFSIGGNCDFGPATLYLAYQYGRNENWAAISGNEFGTQLKGHVFHTGLVVPTEGGSWLTLGAYYTTVESVADDTKTAKAYDLTAYYAYRFSKRTLLFAGMGYGEIWHKMTGPENRVKCFDAAFGLHHVF